MFALRATYHTTTQASPMQLVFGRDAILNIKFEADWKLIKERKQKVIQQNNKKENKARKAYNYQIGDKVLIDKTTGMVKQKFGKDPFNGPYEVQQVNDNGTILVKIGPVLETVNIRLVKPYKE